ncbi:hypothetical protein RJ639_012696 [Escallonia herrerae]|uniref:Uncharacterized protein n=1 Tax=Escallonia herrerae TaxID=1293975 RepID=A0AA88VLM0_9ASTE|nr:hypothetical protein RJ639_012696 [Escallonia herrerae]
MVGVHSTAAATVTFPFPSATVAPVLRKPLIRLSSIYTPKQTRRKNYLRPKILKTLKKPLIPELPSTDPVLLIESPHDQQQQPPELPSEEFQVSETETLNSSGVIEGSVGNFSTRSILKYGLYLVGAFVFQTVIAVWFLGSADSDEKDGNLGTEDKTRVLEMDRSGNSKERSKIVLNGSGNPFQGGLRVEGGGIVYVDESALEAKIVEIRAMARDVREKERAESNGNSVDDNDEDIVAKSGIEKEVDRRLVRLQKRLQSSSKKSTVSPVGKVEDGVDKIGLGAKEVNGALMFEKKFKFKPLLADPSDKPKGFQGSGDRAVTKRKSSISAEAGNKMLGNESTGSTGMDLFGTDQQLDLPKSELHGSDSVLLEEDGGKKAPSEETKSPRVRRKKLEGKRGQKVQGKDIEVEVPEPRNGDPLESTYERSPFEAVKVRESNKLEAQNPQGFTKRNRHAKGRKVGIKKDGNKKSNAKTDMWWLSLPYVLAVLMRRGDDGEGPQGLFTLKKTSQFDGDSAHTVAFEDRGDATNFCYLLQSFFEDLGDFSADIVPLPTSELEEAVESNAMKVLVVKKGQLQLYVGQPLADVEMALCSLVGQS